MAVTEIVAVGAVSITAVDESDVVGVERTGPLSASDVDVGVAVEHAVTTKTNNVIQKTKINFRFIFLS